MKRRTLLQLMASAAASVAVPFDRVRLFAQPRELTPESIATLHEVGSTVLPASLGPQKIAAAVDAFVAWTRGYREGAQLSPGYGHPRLVRAKPTPVPVYVAQLAALDAAAHAKGAPFPALPLETRRALLDDAIARTGVKGLPPRPTGQHVVSDLMAHFFRSSEANDLAQQADVERQVCRKIALTTVRPAPLKG